MWQPANRVTHRLLNHSVCNKDQPSHKYLQGLEIACVGIWLPSETTSTSILSYCISTCPSIEGAEDRKTLFDFQFIYPASSGLSEQKVALGFLCLTL